MRQKPDGFDHWIRFAARTDIGKKRDVNQDEVILCTDAGLFGVSDGMGGLKQGLKASEYVRAAMPKLIEICQHEYADHRSIDCAAQDLRNTVCMMSDQLFRAGNTESQYPYGATFCGVWLLDNRAVVVNIGDSRAYVLRRYKRRLEQITEDHNIAGILYREGQLSKEEALHHPTSSQLTAFVGMNSPAQADVFVLDVQPGDRILICSDGLYSMVDEQQLAKLMRTGNNAERICQIMVNAANENGGRDNISVVYLKIEQ